MRERVRKEQMSQSHETTGFLARFKRLPLDSAPKTILVAVSLCLFCSIIVSATAIVLRPQQEHNKVLEKQRNILEVSGLMEEGGDIQALFSNIEPRLVDLRKGVFVTADAVGLEDVSAYDQRKASKDPALSKALSTDEDIASIQRQAYFATVYLVRNAAQQVETLILPIHGYGLWSTLYGFIALKPDGREIIGLQFYEHAETPGLGGEVDNPRWRALWPGKYIFDDQGNVKITVTKNAAKTGANAQYEVDALAGASLTSRGVRNLVQFWVSENGFGPFLKKITQELARHD